MPDPDPDAHSEPDSHSTPDSGPTPGAHSTPGARSEPSARSEPDSQPDGPLGRLLRIPGRSMLLIGVGVLLAVLFATRSCQGVEISEEQAVDTARAALDAHPGAFIPEQTEAQVLRQGFPPESMWVVVFTVREPDGGPEDFLHHAAVWVHAGSGELVKIDVDDSDGG